MRSTRGQHTVETRVTVRHRLTDASNARHPMPGPEGRRRVGHARHLELAESLVQCLGSRLDCYVLTGGEPTLNRAALLALVGYLASAAVPAFSLETNATVISGPLLDDLHETGLRRLSVLMPSRNPGAYTSAMGFSERDGAERLARAEAIVDTALAFGMTVDVRVPLLRGVNDDADTLLSYAPWIDRGAELKLVPADRSPSSAACDPLELLQLLGARATSHEQGGEQQHQLCHDSRCIEVTAQRNVDRESTLHVSADGCVRADVHAASPELHLLGSLATHIDELEAGPPTLRVVPQIAWSQPLAAVGF